MSDIVTNRMPAAGRKFFIGVAVAIAIIVFIGFAPTFYLKPLFAAPPLSALVFLHGIVFSTWIIVLLTQVTLVAKGRIDLHMRLGIAGACLAAAMVVIGLKTAITAAALGHTPPGAPPALSFLVIPFFAIVLFAILVGAAVALRRNGAAHKRLMILATVAILGAAIARLPLGVTSIPPVFFGIADLFILAGILYDRRTLGRVHPAHIWGGLLIVASQPLQLAIMGTAPWLAFARWLTA